MRARSTRWSTSTPGRKYLLVKTRWGCWYRSYDTTAGARAYTGTKGAFRYWQGFYNIKSVDHYTGAPLECS